MISVIGGELYQYDTGRKVQITSKKNYTISEVHFCNKDSESAFVCNVTCDESSTTAVATIPNILLQSNKDLVVYAVITTDDLSQTVERNVFRVYERKRPDNYVYTETEIFAYKNLEDRIKKLEESSVDIDSEVIADIVKEYMDENPVKTVTKVSELENDSEYITEKELQNKNYAHVSDIPNIPVKSVNGQTGDIRLSAKDIGALSKDTKIPANTSDLSNDSGFITKAVGDLTNYYLKSETYSQEQINQLINIIPKFSIQPVDSLPTTDISATTVYLLKSGNEVDNLYIEYIYVNGTWEYLGRQTVDLSGYALNTDIPTNLSELVNDAGFITNNVSNLVNYYKKDEVYNKDEIDNKGFLTEHQDISGKLDADKLPEVIDMALTQAKESGEFNGQDGQDGYTPQKGVDYFDGEKGADGISATHTWNGTTLIVTSASGTSSADLKGDKGETGVYIGAVEPTDPDVRVWVDPNGEAEEIPTPYVLPTASETVKGGVKIGEGLQMDGDVLGVVPDSEYKLLKTIIIGEDQTDLISVEETFELGLDAAFVVVDKNGLTSDTPLFILFSNNKMGVACGEWIKAGYILRGVCRKLNGIWDVFGYTGFPASGSSMLGQTSAGNVYDVATSGDKIFKIRVYTVSGYGPLPPGMTIRIYGLRCDA